MVRAIWHKSEFLPFNSSRLALGIGGLEGTEREPRKRTALRFRSMKMQIICGCRQQARSHINTRTSKESTPKIWRSINEKPSWFWEMCGQSLSIRCRILMQSIKTSSPMVVTKLIRARCSFEISDGEVVCNCVELNSSLFAEDLGL